MHYSAPLYYDWEIQKKKDDKPSNKNSNEMPSLKVTVTYPLVWIC